MLLKKYKVKIRKNLKIDWDLINIESIDKVKMTKREMLDFAIQIIVDYATKEGYEFESVNNTLSHFPNAYLKKDNELYCLIIEVDEVHNQPQLSIDTINKMKNINKIMANIPCQLHNSCLQEIATNMFFLMNVFF